MTPKPPRQAEVPPIKRAIFLALAAGFFALGALGAVLPGLPTTPFLLLTSYFLVRSSPRLNAALLRSPLFGPMLRDWQERRGVRRAVKIQALALIVVFVGLAVFVTAMPAAARVATVALGLVGIAVVVRLPEVSAPNEAAATTGN
jgi:uncharacterized membrane protein YbaN (DUF454 family)